MNEMIEQVARALEPKCRAFGQGDMPMNVAREFARAAIEAMRAPTVPMMEAGALSVMRPHIPMGGPTVIAMRDAQHHFQVMIDAALAPHQ